MIIPIKHKADWELTAQQNQTQTNKCNILKNNKIFDHDYNVRDKVIVNNSDEYKSETPYKYPFVITQCWTNCTITLQCDGIKIRYNIRCINPHTSNTNIEDIN